jgi:hypothetical protein
MIVKTILRFRGVSISDFGFRIADLTAGGVENIKTNIVYYFLTLRAIPMPVFY